jgi:hypothetical protein
MANIDAYSARAARSETSRTSVAAGIKPQLSPFVVLFFALLAGCAGRALTENVGQHSEALPLRPAPERAFAWANDDLNQNAYFPDPTYSFNPSSTDAVRIANNGPGNYTVQFPGLNVQAGNYQVVAYGVGPSHRCQLMNWGGDTVNVLCVDSSGTPVNSKFVISYTNDFKNLVDANGNRLPAGFLYAEQPDTPSYNPNSAFSYNSSGQLNTILPDELTQVGIGRYIAVLSALNTDQGNAQVTAVGDKPAYCKLNGWVVFPGTADLWVGILCFDATTGAPKNNAFSLQFVSQPGALNDLYDRAYVWADQLQAPLGTGYSPSLFYNYDRLDQSSGNAAEHVATGRYFVGFPHIPTLQQSSVMVSALGDDPNYCHPNNWAFFPDTTVLEVDCFDRFGNPIDESFSAMYLRQESYCGLPDPGLEGAEAPGCSELEHLVHPGELQKRDNPVLRGYANTTGLTLWQPNQPTSIDEIYEGSFAPMVATNPPAILGEFGPASFKPSFTISGVAATTYSRSLLANALPWITFADTRDSTHVSVDIPAGETRPYWTAGLALPKDHSSVTVQMFEARGTSASDTLVNEFQVQLDSSVLVVPVYVHILRDKNNNPPSTLPSGYPYAPVFLSGTLPNQNYETLDEQIAWNVGNLFDRTAVRYPYWAIARRNTSVDAAPERIADPSDKRTATVSLSDGGTEEVPVFGDDIFGQCEKPSPYPSRPVQLRLMGVSFIRQGQGLEKVLLPAASATCSGPLDPSFCYDPKNTVGGTPAGALALQIVKAYDAPASGLPRGIHVIVGGSIFPVGGPVNNANCSELANGISCVNNRYAFIDGTGSGTSGTFDVQTIFHEIGHLIGAGPDLGDDPNEHNLMYGYGGHVSGLLSPSQCQRIVKRAGSF